MRDAAPCNHAAHRPPFDASVAAALTARQVRARYPRFHGECDRCRQRVILYASAEHYTMGDW